MMFFVDCILIPVWFSQKLLQLLVNTRFSVSFEREFVINFDQDFLIVLVFLFLTFSAVSSWLGMYLEDCYEIKTKFKPSHQLLAQSKRWKH